jgi:rubrerythrin
MKPEESIQRINEIKIEIDNWRDSLGEKLSDREIKDIQAYDVALEALEKQIPKEWRGWTTSAFIGTDEYGEPKYADRKFYRCSKCRNGTVVRTNYCPNCGSKMDKEVTK